MKEVSTRGLRRDFELAHRITIQSNSSNVQFFATNGNMNAVWEVTNQTDNKFKCEKEGRTTVDTLVALSSLNAIGGQSKDIPLELELENDVLSIRDVSSKSKKKIKLQTLNKSHDFKIKRPSTGFSFIMTKEDFKNGIQSVSAYASTMDYKVKYQMVCLHFLKNETRFICGDGLRFVIYSQKMTSPNRQVDSEDGIRFLMPVDQAAIIGSVLDGASAIEFVYSDEQTCYIKPQNAMEIILHGIPNEKYIPYENHAYCFDKVRVVIDAKRVDFEECANIVSSIKDKDSEKQSNFPYHAKFEFNDNALEILVDDQKHQCDVECPVDIYHVQGDRQYKSIYPSCYLRDAAYISKKPMLRFYLIDERKSLIVEPIEVDDTNKVNGIPQAKAGTEDPRITMFFTSLVEDE